MIDVQLTGVDAEMNALLAEVARVEQEGVAEVKRATRIVLNALMANTPVWSGETIAAYGIGLNQVGTGAAGYYGGPPGDTAWPRGLGGEANRPGAEGVARSNIEGVLAPMTRLVSVHFGNGVSSGKWDLIDAGEAPRPGAARNPAGVQKPAEVLARSQLGENFR